MRRHASGEAGRLTVSLTRSAPGGSAAELLDGFRAANPSVDVHLTSGFTALHEERLRERAIDAAIVRPPIDLRDDLAVHEIGTEAIIAAVRGDDPLARKRRLRTADVAGRPLVWWPREHGPGMWDRMLDQVFGEGVRPPVAHWEPEEERMLHAVAAGHGITFVTEGRAGAIRVPGVVARRFAGPVPTVPIALAWRRADRNPALRRLVAQARAMAAGRG